MFKTRPGFIVVEALLGLITICTAISMTMSVLAQQRMLMEREQEHIKKAKSTWQINRKILDGEIKISIRKNEKAVF